MLFCIYNDTKYFSIRFIEDHICKTYDIAVGSNLIGNCRILNNNITVKAIWGVI